MQNTTDLTARINARNAVNTRLRQAAPAIFAALRPFVGQKVKTVDGNWTKAFKSALQALPKVPGDYFGNSSYSLSLVFKESRNGERGCHYADASLYIGELDGQTLTNLSYADNYKAEAFRTDYTASEILAARAEVKQAREALQAAERKLSGFGEFDR